MTKIDLQSPGDIEILTLDYVVSQNGDIRDISVMKIDVEGMEIDVLHGALQTIETHHPIIYAEAGTTQEFESLQTFLKPLGYKPTRRFNATATYLFESHI